MNGCSLTSVISDLFSFVFCLSVAGSALLSAVVVSLTGAVPTFLSASLARLCSSCFCRLTSRISRCSVSRYCCTRKYSRQLVLVGATSVLVMRLALVSRLLSETTFSGLLTAVVSGLTSSAPTCPRPISEAPIAKLEAAIVIQCFLTL